MSDSSGMDLARTLVRALQFEGYLLYPYRKSALKNKQRWAFGTLYPRNVAPLLNEKSEAHCEILVQGDAPMLQVTLQALHVVTRTEAHAETWQEADELRFSVDVPWTGRPSCHAFAFAESNEVREGQHYRREALVGTLEVIPTVLRPNLVRVQFALTNQTVCAETDRSKAYSASLAAPHLLLCCSGGRLVSLLEPPAELEGEVSRCTQAGLFPVLIGRRGQRDTMLCAPTILYDYPEIAAESPGDWFDSLEIDELLSLRVATLTDAEKDEVRLTDPRARKILERTERLTEDELASLHGRTSGAGPRLSTGDRVRLAPRPGGDVMDLALKGEIATICAIEQELEGRLLFAVTVDADPGRDLGALGEPGHRFFFEADELEPLP